MRARKVDANHGAIRDALRAAGAQVTDLSAVGDGVPDLLVGPPLGSPRCGEWLLVECKDGEKVPSARKLTPAQEKWHETAMGRQLRVYVVESVEQALQLIQGE